MTDKEKIREEVERLYGTFAGKVGRHGECDICCKLLSFIDSLQEEPVRKVWHDSNKEQPKCESNVVIWSPTLETGELITKCAKVFENRI